MIDTWVTTHQPVTEPATQPDAGPLDASADQPHTETDPHPTLGQQRADALVHLLTAPADSGRTSNTGPAGPSTPHVTAEVVVHVTEDGNHLPDGTPLGDHTVTRMLPDAFVSLLLHDTQRQPIDASPGCHARTFLQYDHLQPYTRGGPTVVANLQRLCGPHNRAKGTGIDTAA